MTLRIGFIGLGNIGEPMAKRLLDAGHDLCGYDLRAIQLHRLQQAGAKRAENIAAVARHSQFICIAVVDDAQVETIVLGHAENEGLLTMATPGTIVLIHSTVSPDLCRRIAREAEQSGVRVVDAPVSGAALAAEHGELTLLVGGDEEVVAECQPLFAALGQQVFHLGPVGAGQTAKICNNLMFTINLRATLEALELAQKAGIEERQMRTVAAVSTGNSWALENIDAMRELINKPRQSVSAQEIGNKDLSLAVRLGEQFELALPITSAVLRG